jgi:hypothetical protein
MGEWLLVGVNKIGQQHEDVWFRIGNHEGAGAGRKYWRRRDKEGRMWTISEKAITNWVTWITQQEFAKNKVGEELRAIYYHYMQQNLAENRKLDMKEDGQPLDDETQLGEFIDPIVLLDPPYNAKAVLRHIRKHKVFRPEVLCQVDESILDNAYYQSRRATITPWDTPAFQCMLYRIYKRWHPR